MWYTEADKTSTAAQCTMGGKNGGPCLPCRSCQDKEMTMTAFVGSLFPASNGRIRLVKVSAVASSVDMLAW